MVAGALTLGNPKRFLNFGYNLIYDIGFGDIYNIISVGGGYAINERFSIVSDNLLLTEGGDIYPVVSLMGKLNFKQKHQVQIGLYVTADDERLPALSYAYFWK